MGRFELCFTVYTRHNRDVTLASGVTGGGGGGVGGQGGRVPPETSDWEIFADVTYREKRGKEKREKG